MHEMSIMQNIIDIIITKSMQEKFTKVKKISLEIGELSCVEPESLRFCFDVVAKNTVAEQADLDINIIQGIGSCNECLCQFEYRFLYDCCPCCHSYDIKKIQGSELKVKDIVVV